MPLGDPFSTPCVVRIQIETVFRRSLRNFSLEGGVDRTDTWPPSVGNSWRTTDDIQDNWGSMMKNIDLVKLSSINTSYIRTL